MRDKCILCNKTKKGKYIYAGDCRYSFVCFDCLKKINLNISNIGY